MNTTETDPMNCLVLRNDQGQYSLWPALRPAPAGWQEVGPEADAATCLAWIDAQGTELPCPTAG